MTFYYVLKTIVYLDNNIREWNKVPEKHQFGISRYLHHFQ